MISLPEEAQEQPEDKPDFYAAFAESEALDLIFLWAVDGAEATAAGPTSKDDVLEGSVEADTIRGLAGDDEIRGGGGGDDLDGGRGSDTLWGSEGDDKLVDLKGANELHGEDGDDEIVGGRANDRLFGGDGVDDIDGGRGADFINGGAGSDLLIGGGGRDTIIGGGGADFMTGGAGNDRFVIESFPLVVVSITDFENGKDRIEISGFEGVERFADIKVEHANCGIVVSDQDETFSIVLLGYFEALDKRDFLFS